MLDKKVKMSHRLHKTHHNSSKAVVLDDVFQMKESLSKKIKTTGAHETIKLTSTDLES